MDELNRRLSHDPAAYAKAVELLARYEKIEHLSWAKVEDYLSGLNEDETHLLDVALVARSQNNARKASPDLAEQIALLQQQIDALSRGSSIQNTSPSPTSTPKGNLEKPIFSPKQ
jgi:DNA-binding transcriptional MerR regulator